MNGECPMVRARIVLNPWECARPEEPAKIYDIEVNC